VAVCQKAQDENQYDK